MVSFVIKTCRVIRMTHSETFVIEDSSNSQFSPAWNQNANLHPCTNVANFIGENENSNCTGTGAMRIRLIPGPERLKCVIHVVQAIVAYSKKGNTMSMNRRPVKMMKAIMVFHSKLLLPIQGLSERRMNIKGKEMANGI